MIFLCDASNTVTPIVQPQLRQGEINANEIVILAPYASNTAVTLRVTLPNGLIIPQEPEAFVLVNVPTPEGLSLNTIALNAWRMRVDKSITEIAGNLVFQFAFTVGGASDGTLPATYTTTSVVTCVPRGVPTLPQYGSYEPSLIDVYQAAISAEAAASDAVISAAADAAYVRENVGDMQAAFDELHAYAQALIGGAEQ